MSTETHPNDKGEPVFSDAAIVALGAISKDLSRVRKLCTEYMKACTRRKRQIDQWNQFFKVLLADGRITKEELEKYSPKENP